MKSQILCATDFSTAADDAAEAALALASRLGADLHLVHVAGPISELFGTMSDFGLLKSFVDIANLRLWKEIGVSVQKASFPVSSREAAPFIELHR
ncbi:MAG: universal stress protein [Verrucomicrobiales bacterium]